MDDAALRKSMETLRVKTKAAVSFSKYDDPELGSWMARISVKPPLRISWNGGEKMFRLEQMTMAGEDRNWKELWSARKPANLETALQAAVDKAVEAAAASAKASP